jgi:hypothetical protein
VSAFGREPLSRVVYNYTEAYTTFGLRVALAPDVPNNGGSFCAVTVRAPEASVLNCRHPLLPRRGTCSAASWPALSPALPERAMAEGMAGLWSTDVHGTGPDGNCFALRSRVKLSALPLCGAAPELTPPRRGRIRDAI